jgi:hypothetical protein
VSVPNENTTTEYRVERHSGRSGADWRVVYKGSWMGADGKYEQIAEDLRQGGVRFVCSCGDILRSCSAPRLRSKW